MRTILYAQASFAERSICSQRELAERQGVGIDEVITEESGFERPLRERRQGGRLFGMLRNGDTLVLTRTNSLGGNYAEISDAIRSLTRRGVTVKTLAQGLVFEGLNRGPAQEAARDALIAFAAAVAEAETDSQPVKIYSASRTTSNRVAAQPAFDRESASIHLRVLAAYMGVLVIVACVAGGLWPGGVRDPSANSGTVQESEPVSAPSLARGEHRSISDGGKVKEQSQADSSGRPQVAAAERLESATGIQEQSLGERINQNAAARAVPDQTSKKLKKAGEEDGGQASVQWPLTGPKAKIPSQQWASRAERDDFSNQSGLSRSQELEIRDTVVDWRSARVDRPEFPVALGASVPRHVHLATFPRRLMSHVPNYRGYKFVVVKGNIAVVDPQSYRIIAIIAG